MGPLESDFRSIPAASRRRLRIVVPVCAMFMAARSTPCLAVLRFFRAACRRSLFRLLRSSGVPSALPVSYVNWASWSAWKFCDASDNWSVARENVYACSLAWSCNALKIFLASGERTANALFFICGCALTSSISSSGRASRMSLGWNSCCHGNPGSPLTMLKKSRPVMLGSSTALSKSEDRPIVCRKAISTSALSSRRGNHVPEKQKI
mmetsp:Transcript_33608/g.94547  ORF Transcript_33608/g.94547 Transcript_33608/m.94547 type:complete len:208 (+) Transcript_33608:269-892(+)